MEGVSDARCQARSGVHRTDEEASLQQRVQDDGGEDGQRPGRRDEGRGRIRSHDLTRGNGSKRYCAQENTHDEDKTLCSSAPHGFVAGAKTIVHFLTPTFLNEQQVSNAFSMAPALALSSSKGRRAVGLAYERQGAEPNNPANQT